MLALQQFGGLLQKRRAAAGGGGAYVADAVTFDGTTTHVDRSGTLSGGSSVTTAVLISMWFKLKAGGAGDGQFQMLFEDGSTNALQILRMTDNTIRITSSVNNVFKFSTSAAYTIGSGTAWHHLLASWNGSGPTVLLYMDDSPDLGTVVDNTNSFTDWSVSGWGIGDRAGGSFLFCGEMADLYIDGKTSPVLDISDVAVRRKFIDASHKPVDLGANGSTPTGSQPLICMKGVGSAWQNVGAGGSFTVSGTMTAGTPP
jgi:hypothetical protein